MIIELTPEQEALIPGYREKWKKVALSTEPIDRQRASEAVKALYAFYERKEPTFIFCESPDVRIKIVLEMQEQLGKGIGCEINRTFLKDLFYYDWRKLGSPPICRQIGKHFRPSIRRLEDLVESDRHLTRQDYSLHISTEKYYSSTCMQSNAYAGSIADFCISILNLNYNRDTWQLFEMLSNFCSLIYPYENMAIICDRPNQLSIDSEGRFHAEGEPAMQFRDGYSLYAYHGISLPESYGKVPPHQWDIDWYLKNLDLEESDFSDFYNYNLKLQLIEVLPVELLRSHWLLEEKNSELRRSLIQRLGYGRLCQELQAEKLDTWQEYEILRIDAKIDEEPICLLKMNCPSTGDVHAIRVPPNLTSAREAVRWINWGIDPEDFSVQT